MRVNTRRRSLRQSTLWPDAIDNVAQTRNLCGDFVEEWAAATLHATRLATNGTCDYCPDLSRPSIGNFETKSVGENGYTIVYEARRLKDRAFVDAGNSLFYVLLKHKTKVAGIGDVDELYRRIAGSIQYAILLPFRFIDGALGCRPLKCLNKEYTKRGGRLGYGTRSKGYGEGRTLPLSMMLDLCDIEMPAAPCQVLGVDVPTVRLCTRKDYAHFLGTMVNQRRKARNAKQ